MNTVTITGYILKAIPSKRGVNGLLHIVEPGKLGYRRVYVSCDDWNYWTYKTGNEFSCEAEPMLADPKNYFWLVNAGRCAELCR